MHFAGFIDYYLLFVHLDQMDLKTADYVYLGPLLLHTARVYLANILNIQFMSIHFDLPSQINTNDLSLPNHAKSITVHETPLRYFLLHYLVDVDLHSSNNTDLVWSPFHWADS